MSVIGSNILAGASAQGVGGYTIDQSLRLNDNDSANLSRTPASAGNRKTWTWSGWVKASYTGSGQKALFSARSTTTDQFHIWLNGTGSLDIESGGGYGRLIASGIYRDPSAWYHIVVVLDATNATTADKCRIYVNGERITSFSTVTNFSNRDYGVNSTIQHRIGSQATAAEYFDGYMAEVNFIDGQALDPSYFGETDETYGHWKPIAYTGSYGTNGFYLDFSNSGSIGEDQAGSNDWTANNLATTDVVLDSPTNNFCTWNPLVKPYGTTTFSEGNLKSTPSATWNLAGQGTFGVNSGKWYWEVTIGSASTNSFIGISIDNTDTDIASYQDNQVFLGYYAPTGEYIMNTSWSSYGASYSSSDIIGVALDADAGTVTFYKNNSSQGSITLSSAFTGKTLLPAAVCHTTYAFANFGQDSSFAGNKTAQNNTDANGYGDFYYSPPSGFLALCTANLSDPAVVPGENFNTVLWTGDGTSSRSITGVGFQPDFNWLKERTSTSYHCLHDSIRGTNNILYSNTTDAEQTIYTNGLLSFDSDGITVGDSGAYNESSQTYVAWNWKANNTSGSSNTDGSITSTVAANVDAGFSIVSYTGTGSVLTYGHGLSNAPEVVIVKNRSVSASWFVYHAGLGSPDKYLLLDSTNSVGTNTGAWNNTAPSSSVITIGSTFGALNTSGNNYISYCFHSVDGYSKFGSYTGNGSTDGPFVYTGFRPAFVMIKRTDTANGWAMLDVARSPYNDVDDFLYANASDAEYANTTADMDHLSNGFKLRSTGFAVNASGGTYIYMAFAEYDFKHSNGR